MGRNGWPVEETLGERVKVARSNRGRVLGYGGYLKRKSKERWGKGGMLRKKAGKVGSRGPDAKGTAVEITPYRERGSRGGEVGGRERGWRVGCQAR